MLIKMVNFYKRMKDGRYVIMEDDFGMAETEVLQDIQELKVAPVKKFETVVTYVQGRKINMKNILYRVIGAIVVLSLISTIMALSYRSYNQGRELETLRHQAAECDTSLTKTGHHKFYGKYTKQSCIFNGNPTKKNISLDISKYRCDFQLGVGSGGTKLRIGQQSGKDCIAACLYLKQFDNTINGVCTRVRSSKFHECYCERGMTSIRPNRFHQTCTLMLKSGSSHEEVDPDVCLFRVGTGVVNGKHASPEHHRLIKKETVQQCVDDCLYLKRINVAINGVTYDSADGSCICLTEMQNITYRYKTCFLTHTNTLCAMRGVSFVGNDIRTIANVSSWIDCSDFCRQDQRCKVWDFIGQQCLLKSSDQGGRLNAVGHISGSRICGLHICEFKPSFWIQNVRMVSESTGNSCVEECLYLKKYNQLINGVSVYSDGKKGGCFCHYNMTKIDDTVKTCFLKPHSTESSKKFIDTSYTCDLQPGGGFSSSDIYLKDIHSDDCFRACLYLEKMDNAIYGISVLANSTISGCWCLRKSYPIHRSTIFKSCNFKKKNSHINIDGKSCVFKHGDTDGRPSYKGLKEKKECLSICSSIRSVDETVTGLSWKPQSKHCYCVRNMTTINGFKGCLLKNMDVTIA